MSVEELMMESEEKMEGALDHLVGEFSAMRTGRANIHVLDGVKVDYYGTETPLSQLATIHAPEATLITVSPFDRNVLGDVEKAIMASNLGINPMNDGKLIRLPIPPLTEERRVEMAKLCSKMGEVAKTAVRNVRRHSNETAKSLEKDKEVSEDIMHDTMNDVQTMTDDYIKKIDSLVDHKQAEIMQV
jgi:ribosome recycling factor